MKKIDDYEKYLSKGASEEYAREQAKKYGEMAKQGGDPWRWNAGDPYELAMKMAKLDAYNKSQAAKAGGKSGLTSTATMNMVSTIQRLGAPDGQGGQYADTRKGGRKEVQAVSNELPGFSEIKGKPGQFIFDGNFTDLKVYGPEFMDPKDGTANAVDLTEAENIQPHSFYAKLDKDGNKRYYMIANAEFDDATQGWSQANPFNSPTMLGLGPNPFMDKSWLSKGTPETRRGVLPGQGMTQHWERNDARGTVMGDIAIDITDQINSKEIGMQINEYMNYDLNQEMTPSTADNQDYINVSNRVDRALVDAGVSNQEWQNYLMTLSTEAEKKEAEDALLSGGF